MRLKTIKLAGFKSFVDPTPASFPENLTAVVGPNGCGKSNIIDAVRWVMGESSAKHLRGESMADVIFNGSNARKPVAQASIELVFDNSDGTVTGEYGKFNEISVKRQVTRDGQSNYYLNGTKCRRKDISDIFLGTGLGPRSYAIIEQGMISRLIEAKPEELRVYIEEAAGISKYKARRRETENRMRRTRENLERLTDIRDELERQIERLSRQASAAEKYKQYKEEERHKSAQLKALRWRGLNGQVKQLDQIIAELEVAMEARIAEQRHVDAEIERLREGHNDAQEGFNQVQQRFYALGAEVARLEQSIQHQRERRQHLDRDPPARLLLLRLVDHAHPCSGKHAQKEVVQVDVQPDFALLLTEGPYLKGEVISQGRQEQSKLKVGARHKLACQYTLTQHPMKTLPSHAHHLRPTGLIALLFERLFGMRAGEHDRLSLSIELDPMHLTCTEVLEAIRITVGGRSVIGHEHRPLLTARARIESLCLQRLSGA